MFGCSSRRTPSTFQHVNDTALLAENHTAAHVNDGVVAFLRSWAFTVDKHELSRPGERWLPLDVLFALGPDVQVFGLQHKALYRLNSQPRPSAAQPYPRDDDRWKITETQGNLLDTFDWVHLSLCELAYRPHSMEALHATYFLAGWPERYYLSQASGAVRRREVRRLLHMSNERYARNIGQRWMDFFWGLEAGMIGVRPGTAVEAMRLFDSAITAALAADQFANAQEIEELSLSLVAVHFPSRRAVLFASRAVRAISDDTSVLN